MRPAAIAQPGAALCLLREPFCAGAWQLGPVGGAPPCAVWPDRRRRKPFNRSWARQAAPQTPQCADEPSRSKRPGDRGQCRGTTTEHRSSPWPPHQPKLARNSGTRTFCSTPKRCNSNGAISMFEIHVGELRATFLRNHNTRCHKGPQRHHTGPQAEDNSSPGDVQAQETTQAQKTPTSPATTTARSTGALHPLRGGAPVTWRCTRTEEVHCLRIRCSAPTHKNKRGTDRTHLLPATTSPGTGRRASNDDPVSVDSGPSPRPRWLQYRSASPVRRCGRPQFRRPAPCR